MHGSKTSQNSPAAQEEQLLVLPDEVLLVLLDEVLLVPPAPVTVAVEEEVVVAPPPALPFEARETVPEQAPSATRVARKKKGVRSMEHEDEAARLTLQARRRQGRNKSTSRVADRPLRNRDAVPMRPTTTRSR